MDTADRAEAESICRYLRLSELGSAISEAARRADARLRLENALRYAPMSSEALRRPTR